ncbi:hypothetical protein RUM44_000629 [Polyplax serrata]|uniref:Secreted protein n=1 Tax=Polyplax serrata TaxID=468196 RepID=A0ABR1B5Z2_POLSC
MKLFVLAVFIVIVFYPVRRTVTFQATFQHANHNQVFRYVSSVENFKALNPTIVAVTKMARLNDTSFSLEYEERLSQVPAVHNYGRAVYSLGKEPDGSHKMTSDHSTCFYTDLFCLDSSAILKISSISGRETGYTEEITYTCPWILGFFCFEEVAHQRKSIIFKLKQVFSE